MKSIRQVVAEMVGKVQEPFQNSYWVGMNKMFNRINSVPVNLERNDYDLFRSIYHNSIVNKKGLDYQIAAALGKPIINITAGFVMGRGCTIELKNENNDAMIQKTEDAINDWLKSHQKTLYNVAKYNYRDGDAYVHMDEFGKLTEIDAKGAEVIIDPISGAVIGCDIKQTVYINDVDAMGMPSGTQKTWIYVKQYRNDSTRIFRYIDGQPDKAEILWERVFTADGAQELSAVSEYSEKGENLGIKPGVVKERKLAVRMLHNEPEAQAIYGNSDYQNVLALFKEYADVIKEAKKSVVYNSSPIPVLKGVINPQTIADASDDPAAAPKSDQGAFVWGQDKILYLNGDKSDAKMLQGSSVMTDVTALLAIYFYLFVQGTETPEFVFGTAINSSNASTQTQVPIFAKKIERKQQEMSEFIKELVETYVERRILISDPQYLTFLDGMPEIRVNFPAIDDEDKTMTLALVTYAYDSKLITGNTVLDLILGDKIKNIGEEIKRAATEAKAAAKEAAPLESDRLVKDLLNKANTQPNSEATKPVEGSQTVEKPVVPVK